MKKIKTMNLILILLGLIALTFTGVMIITFWRMGAVPDSLIVAVFGALFGEAGIMGGIKITKVKNNTSQNREENGGNG